MRDYLKKVKGLLGKKKGQHIAEYAIIASIVAAAVLAMSTYVFRSVQATTQVIQREAGNE